MDRYVVIRSDRINEFEKLINKYSDDGYKIIDNTFKVTAVDCSIGIVTSYFVIMEL